MASALDQNSDWPWHWDSSRQLHHPHYFNEHTQQIDVAYADGSTDQMVIAVDATRFVALFKQLCAATDISKYAMERSRRVDIRVTRSATA